MRNANHRLDLQKKNSFATSILYGILLRYARFCCIAFQNNFEYLTASEIEYKRFCRNKCFKKRCEFFRTSDLFQSVRDFFEKKKISLKAQVICFKAYVIFSDYT